MSSPQGNTGNKIYGTPTSVSRADVTLTPSPAVNTEHAKLEGDELPFKPPLKNASPKSSRFVLTSTWGRIVVPCMVMCLIVLVVTNQNQGQLHRESFIDQTSNVVVVKNIGLPQEEDGPWPKVAWLMSFPNSGTSYTMHMTQFASAQSAASNYGDEARLSDGRSNVPLFEDKPKVPTSFPTPGSTCQHPTF
jgi:hypothetical protein